MQTIGARLKSERKRLGITQAKAAEITGVSHRAWNRYELDLSYPNAKTLAALCHAGANANFILTGQFAGYPIERALIDTGFVRPAPTQQGAKP